MANTATLTFDKTNYTTSKDDDGNLVLTLEGTAYDANRPEGVTVEAEKLVDDYRQLFIASVIDGASDVIAAAMKKDKHIAQAHVVCKVNRGFDIEATVTREREGWNPKTREPLTTFGSTSVRVTTPYRKVGTIKVACATMSAKIKEAIG